MRFPHLLGNESLKRSFSAVSLDRIGPSIIINGPSGCGKVTAAKDIAASILCTAKDDAPCGVCPSCKRFYAGTNSDFELFGDTESAPNVDKVRELRSRSFIKSGDSGTKVIIIAGADRLNAASQNVLLKVLEEPMNTVFILTCVNYLSLLQTVRSRCSVFQIEPLPEDVIISELSKQKDHSPEEITKVAGICGGSLGYAKELLEKGIPAVESISKAFIASLGDELKTYKAASEFGTLSRDDYIAFCLRAEELINESLTASSDPSKLIKIYDYINYQLKLMPQNPSVPALSGALTAFCGDLYGGRTCPR